MAYRNLSHDRLRKIDAAHHLHPFTDHADLRRAGSRIITHADGVFVYDVDGTEILDGMAGLWCVNVGYGRDELAEVAAQQMKELPYYNSFFRCSTPSPVLLAEKLAQLAPPNMNQVFYGSSGSEANDTALRLVRQYWALKGKPEKRAVISRHWAYHGSTIAATSLGGMSAMHGQLHGAVPEISHVMCPYAFELAEPSEDDESFGLRAARAVEERILEIGPDKVAAFIGEPIQGAGGVKIPPASYWPEIQRICERHDILLMLDEVITGYGRTGEWFAAQTMGITADTITTAKALTSGYQPLSALLVSDRVADVLVNDGGEFYHGYTYSGHPVACAVALANLAIIEREGLIERVRDDTGPYLQQVLETVVSQHPIVGEARSFGMLAAMEIVRDQATRERYPGDVAGSVCRDHAIDEGLMMRAVGDTMILSPPLTWTRDTIDLAITRVMAALDRTQASLSD